MGQDITQRLTYQHSLETIFNDFEPIFFLLMSIKCNLETIIFRKGKNTEDLSKKQNYKQGNVLISLSTTLIFSTTYTFT